MVNSSLQSGLVPQGPLPIPRRALQPTSRTTSARVGLLTVSPGVVPPSSPRPPQVRLLRQEGLLQQPQASGGPIWTMPRPRSRSPRARGRGHTYISPDEMGLSRDSPDWPLSRSRRSPSPIEGAADPSEPPQGTQPPHPDTEQSSNWLGVHGQRRRTWIRRFVGFLNFLCLVVLWLWFFYLTWNRSIHPKPV